MKYDNFFNQNATSYLCMKLTSNQNAFCVIFNGVVLLQEGLNVFQILVLKISFVSFDTFGLIIITGGSYSILEYFWGNKTKEGERERAIEREEERERERKRAIEIGREGGRRREIIFLP